MRHLHTVQLVGAAGRSIQTTNEIHERRFAGARGTHDRDELALVYLDGHRSQRVHDALAATVVLHQIAHANDWLLFMVVHAFSLPVAWSTRSSSGCCCCSCCLYR